jgi:hypothetical protein
MYHLKAVAAVIVACLILFLVGHVAWNSTMFEATQRISTTTIDPTPAVAVVKSAKYSIVVQTYKRLDTLREFLGMYSVCKSVDKIFVVWNDIDTAPPADLAASYPEGAEIRLIRSLQNTINNRFTSSFLEHGLTSDAILSFDDDIRVSCADVEFMFSEWKLAPDLLFGFLPRFIRYDALSRKYLYVFDLEDHSKYSVVLTGAAMFHQKYLDSYRLLPERVHLMVDELRNCEDLAFNFMIAQVTRKAPVAVHTSNGELLMKKLSGLSTMPDHTDKRNRCLQEFAKVFGEYPLIKSERMVSRAVAPVINFVR